MKKILVATDFSERSDRALRRAVLLAREFDAGLALVHVVDDDQPRRIVETETEEAKALLRQMAATLRNVDGVACETRVLLASPFAAIVQEVTDTSPDLLVIGPHRRQVLRDVFIGTTAERVIRSVDCPVLMVNAPPAGSYRHILQTTDLSDSSRDALRRFLALGIGEQTQNSLLHVFNAPALRLVMGHTLPKDNRDDIGRDPTALKRIEQIVHPLVGQDRAAFIEIADSDILVFDIPLLFETGGDARMDAVAVVSVDADTQRERVLARGTMTEDQFQTIRAKQMPDAEKRARADYVIVTDSMDHAQQQVQDVIADIRKRMKHA